MEFQLKSPNRKFENLELKEARLKAKDALVEVIALYKKEVPKFEAPLKGIAAHSALNKEEKLKMNQLLGILTGGLMNMRILEEELGRFDRYDGMEQWALIEIGERILSRIYTFVRDLPQEMPAIEELGSSEAK